MPILDHHPGQRADPEAVGPHSGPYGCLRARRVRYADRAPLAGTAVKVGGAWVH